MRDNSSLALGTVQLGLPYGVANRTGQPSQDESVRLVGAAWQGGIRHFDTAQAYGRSEEVLGVALARLGLQRDARVVSKLDPGVDHRDPAAVRAAVRASLQRLGIARLAGMLLHREASLGDWPAAWPRCFQPLVREGLVEGWGVSVYTAAAAANACACEGLSVLQVPDNALDARMPGADIPRRTSAAGIRTYIRSVYLQGLLVLDPDQLPAHMAFAREALRTFHGFCREHAVDARAFALHCMSMRWSGALLVVGAETAEQVAGSVELAGRPVAPELVERWERMRPAVPDMLLDPSRWPTP